MPAPLAGSCRSDRESFHEQRHRSAADLWWTASAAIDAHAQKYPNRPIRIIAQFQPGTSTDILARVIAQKLTESWGQQVVVDNQPGAGGIVGTELGARAVPDGYTLTMGVSSAFGINPTLYSKLPYDAIRDFAPITNIALTRQTLFASPSFTAKSVKKLVAAAKAKPASINYASLEAARRVTSRWKCSNPRLRSNSITCRIKAALPRTQT